MAVRSFPTTSAIGSCHIFSSKFQTNSSRPLDFIDGVRKADNIICSAKKKISIADQILDYIEGGPKLRKWYGAPDLKSSDDALTEYDDQDAEETRDAVLITDGDCEIGQMIILQLVVKRARVKAIVKDKRSSMEAFGSYVELISGDPKDQKFVTKALRGVRAIIFPREGFLSNLGNLNGVKHAILLSQLSAYRSSGGLQAFISANARKLAERDEEILLAMEIPFTIIRTGKLEDITGGSRGFSFEKDCSMKGTLSKEDAALICIEALNVVPEKGYSFEVVNGEEMVSDWTARLTNLMNNKM